MVGRSVDDLYPRTHHHPGEVVMSLDRIVGQTKPLSASLELRRGEVLGIAGLIGAGRTELFAHHFWPRSGEKRPALDTRISRACRPAQRWDQGVGMVSEDRKTEGLALQMSIADNITLSNPHGLGPMGLVFPSRQDAASFPWIKKLSIKCASPRQSVGNLSGGNQQKVAIARLLHHNADVLLLDEPTRGVNIGAEAQIYQLINELAVGDPASGRKPSRSWLSAAICPNCLASAIGSQS